MAAYSPITLVNAGGQVQAQANGPEAATQTFKVGVPLRFSSGNLAQCDTSNDWGAADFVAGVSSSYGQNLTTAGTALGGVSEATAPNQASSAIIPVGAWMRDGSAYYYKADGNNVFEIALKSGQTFTQALVLPNTYYALQYDSTTKYWFCDSTDTSGNQNVINIIGVNPNDSTKVRFTFKAAQRVY